MFELFTAGVLEPLTAAGLILLAGFTSFVTGAMGLGGGMLLLVVMASTMPIAALIPVHGLVQLGANASRAVMTFKHLDRTMFRYFALGTVLGAAVASLVVVQLPLTLIQLAIAVFLLLMVWGIKPKTRETSPRGSVVAGALTTFLSMFVGASGPMVASVVFRNGYNKLTHTATFATCMTFQHSLKAIVFTFVGFAFWQWLPLVLAMIASGAIGTWLGLKLLNRIPADKFRLLFKIILTVLALRLLYQALASVF
ncbi:sulfite exporter TauE/SafE family protein [Aestuariibacter sp. GS-14]|uniref:sulfite exporter TauE/SafE family protein n=1 Tax=Aestuariibacter sp. GS-14 TaxID=2590670 RepID=UPI00112AA0FC|nr:sulfite exporter TauE/SafE family protein [Aestuariibacter sp. GS-14]TPV58502.1 sulfite exporter TauE/SafE family protein [Aestuariibacter sp. GS-14]